MNFNKLLLIFYCLYTEYTEDDRKTLDSFLNIHDSRMESPSIEMAETFFEIVNKSTAPQ